MSNKYKFTGELTSRVAVEVLTEGDAEDAAGMVLPMLVLHHKDLVLEGSAHPNQPPGFVTLTVTSWAGWAPDWDDDWDEDDE